MVRHGKTTSTNACLCGQNRKKKKKQKRNEHTSHKRVVPLLPLRHEREREGERVCFQPINASVQITENEVTGSK